MDFDSMNVDVSRRMNGALDALRREFGPNSLRSASNAPFIRRDTSTFMLSKSMPSPPDYCQ
jgi:hypothetical protein